MSQKVILETESNHRHPKELYLRATVGCETVFLSCPREKYSDYRLYMSCLANAMMLEGDTFTFEIVEDALDRPQDLGEFLITHISEHIRKV